MADQKQNGSKNIGTIVEIKGVVLDAVFPDFLPEINTALSIKVTDRDDGATELISATIASARLRWTRPTAFLGAPRSSTRASRSRFRSAT
jgi:hypothetical protein